MATAQHMYAALHGMWQEAVEAKEKAADTAQERAMELAAARQRMVSLEAEVVARVLPPLPCWGTSAYPSGRPNRNAPYPCGTCPPTSSFAGLHWTGAF